MQFEEPLPEAVLAALREALAADPGIGLYVYGHYGLPVDGSLEFLRGFETLKTLSLNVAD